MRAVLGGNRDPGPRHRSCLTLRVIRVPIFDRKTQPPRSQCGGLAARSSMLFAIRNKMYQNLLIFYLLWETAQIGARSLVRNRLPSGKLEFAAQRNPGTFLLLQVERHTTQDREIVSVLVVVAFRLVFVGRHDPALLRQVPQDLEHAFARSGLGGDLGEYQTLIAAPGADHVQGRASDTGG